MAASDCVFRLLSKSVITEQQYEDLKRARYTKEAWSRVANNIRKSTQKYHKLLDVLEYFEMSRIVSMLETKFGKIALITFQQHFFECMPSVA